MAVSTFRTFFSLVCILVVDALRAVARHELHVQAAPRRRVAQRDPVAAAGPKARELAADHLGPLLAVCGSSPCVGARAHAAREQQA